MGTRSAETEVKLQFTSTIRNLLDSSQYASASIGTTILSGKLQTGVGASQGNRAWELRSQTMTGGTTNDIDLYDMAGWDIGAGAGRDSLGLTMTNEEIVTLIIYHVSGSGQLEIMPSSPANGITWGPSLTVANGGALKAGGVFMMHQPNTDAFDIQDGVSNVLRLGANGADLVYSVFLLARHDDDESSSSSTSSLSSSSSSSSTSTSSTSSQCSSSSSSASSSSASSASSSSNSSSSTSTQSNTTSSLTTTTTTSV